MGFLLWIIFGAIAGWFASTIMKSDNSLFWDIVLGISGAVIGGYIMSLFGANGATGFDLYSLFIAVMGAVVLIWIGRRLHLGYR